MMKTITGRHRHSMLLISVIALLMTLLVASTSCTAAPVPDDPDAPVQHVDVIAQGMSYFPDTIEVPRGTRLMIHLHNDDPSQLHDLMVPGRGATARLSPGATESIDAGVITSDIEAYCTIAGHREQGMVLTITVVDP